MFLPYGSGGCQIPWHYHPSSDQDWAKLSTYSLMSNGCDGHKVEAILSFLNAESLAAWFGSADRAQAIVYYTPRHWQKAVAAAAHATFDPNGTHAVSLSYNDLHCHTCGAYVSKELEQAHWDDLCSTCYRHSDQCECCISCGYHPCECCENCLSAPGWCECCSYCGAQECECEQCEDCGNTEHYCSCGSGGGLYGSTKKAPWETREDSPIDVTLPSMSDCKYKQIDPIQAAANFYLLDAIKSSVRMAQVTGADDRWSAASQTLKSSDSMLAAVTVSGERSYRALVEYLAPNFLAYSLSAVGGELRYHKAIGGKVLSSSRSDAWDQFVQVVQTKGADVLFEADTLFQEFGGGAYGGPKWGTASKIVGQFVKGSMPAWLFVDRVFTLQHNGGCFLNKVSWARRNGRGWNLDKMLSLLNAHAGEVTDWATLLDCATPEVRQMFEMSDRAIRRLARRHGGDLPRIVRKPRSRYTESAW